MDEILDDLREGKLDSFYLYVYPGLLQYARRHLAECAMYAEDCVQNAVYKAWERSHSFESEYTLKAFLYITIKNEVISIHRKRSTKERYIGRHQDLDNQETFINTIIEQEAHTMLFNYILGLPEREKQICILCYIEGFSNNEVAEMLGISSATVKRDKSRALEILRLHLKDSLILILYILNYKI